MGRVIRKQSKTIVFYYRAVYNQEKFLDMITEKA